MKEIKYVKLFIWYDFKFINILYFSILNPFDFDLSDLVQFKGIVWMNLQVFAFQ